MRGSNFSRNLRETDSSFLPASAATAGCPVNAGDHPDFNQAVFDLSFGSFSMLHLAGISCKSNVQAKFTLR